MMKYRIRILSAFILLTNVIYSQKISVEKIEPLNWWTGMKWHNLQLMIYGNNLSDAEVSIDNPAIKITKVHHIENRNYLFVDIEIPESIEADTYQLLLTNGIDKVEYDFPIYERVSYTGKYQGFDASDVIYLITPDRFVNGDTSND